jgi:hypothetical protein
VSDELELRVGIVDLGNGPQECAEPAINGESLVDLLARAEAGRVRYAGLAPEDLARVLTDVESGRKAQVLRCTCGDDLCSYAQVTVELGADEVVWHGVHASHREHADAHATLGPWRFSRTAYERALAEPIRVDGRLRTTP